MNTRQWIFGLVIAGLSICALDEAVSVANAQFQPPPGMRSSSPPAPILVAYGRRLDRRYYLHYGVSSTLDGANRIWLHLLRANARPGPITVEHYTVRYPGGQTASRAVYRIYRLW